MHLSAGPTYLHDRLQLALEREVDEVGFQAEPVVDGVDVGGQPHEGPPFGHGVRVLAGGAGEDGGAAVCCSEPDRPGVERNGLGERDRISGGESFGE